MLQQKWGSVLCLLGSVLHSSCHVKAVWRIDIHTASFIFFCPLKSFRNNKPGLNSSFLYTIGIKLLPIKLCTVMVQIKEFIAQIGVFVNKNIQHFLRVEWALNAHNIDLWIFVLLIVVSKDSHLYNQKPESNGHSKYIGKERRLKWIEESRFCFYFHIH